LIRIVSDTWQIGKFIPSPFSVAGRSVTDRPQAVQPAHQNYNDLSASGGLEQFLASFPLGRAGANPIDLHGDRPAASGVPGQKPSAILAFRMPFSGHFGVSLLRGRSRSFSARKVHHTPAALSSRGGSTAFVLGLDLLFQVGDPLLVG
jgi:hypothetical protein